MRCLDIGEERRGEEFVGEEKVRLRNEFLHGGYMVCRCWFERCDRFSFFYLANGRGAIETRLTGAERLTGVMLVDDS